MREVARARGKTVSQIALNWNLSKGFLVLAGTRTPEQARENIGASDFLLSDSEVEEIDRAVKTTKQFIKNPQECD